MDTLEKLTQTWKENIGNEMAEVELRTYFDTPEYRQLSYYERNKGFITASKLKDYENVPLFAHWRHNEGKTTDFDDQDYFIVGQALDDLLTYGEAFYQKTYAVVSRRVGKDADEGRAAEKILLTELMEKQVRKMHSEAMRHPLFPQKPTKHHLVWLAFGKYPCKAELDDFVVGAVKYVDYKSTANITSFEPENYDIQAGFYFAGLLEKYNQKCMAEFCVMDKHKWSRSHVWQYTVPYLEGLQGRINGLIEKWVRSQETGIWAPPDLTSINGLKKLWASPFYDQYDRARSASPTIV